MSATEPTSPSTLSPRAREVLAAARELLEEEGPDGLSMRRLGDRLGISAPAFYRHFPDKRALENTLIYEAFWDLGDLLLAAIEDSDDPITDLAAAYRAYALEHPHLYDLLYQRPLDRDSIDPAGETHAGEAIRRLSGNDPISARMIWAYAHGMIDLELKGRFPHGTDVTAVWRRGIASLKPALGL